LDALLTRDEIDDIVKHVPNDKAPGHDWFNGPILRKCWGQVKPGSTLSMMNFIRDVWICRVSIRHTSLLYLIKTENSENTSDCKPISLVRLALKLLANRLPIIVTHVLHKNQYGFIKQKTIHDCLAWSSK
jgi:hypothetical protein